MKNEYYISCVEVRDLSLLDFKLRLKFSELFHITDIDIHIQVYQIIDTFHFEFQVISAVNIELKPV